MNNWISIRDQLPEEWDHVLLYLNDGQRRIGMFVNSAFTVIMYRGDDDAWFDRLKPTHWMPLPEPPEAA